MDQNNNARNLLLKILECDIADKLNNLVETEPYFAQVKWVPYGGFSNNTGVITGQMKEPENSLIEKITNSIDAILMRKCQEEGIEPRDQSRAPKDMEEAVRRYFGGRDEIRSRRSELAKELIRLSAIGRKDKPTITIIDKGEGQTPNAIPKTILSLQQEIKKKIRFVYGTYNQGGSSALGFCHDSSRLTSYVQLVLCRRAQTIKTDDPDSNYFGFTLVRSRYDEESGNYTYEYFVDQDNNIPKFSYNESIRINEYDFSEGCVIRLYDYELSNSGNILFRGLNESIEKKLSYSPLPMFLQELRDYKGDTEYTIFGFREKMERLDTKVMHPGFPADYPADLGEIGKKAIRIFVLQHKSKHKEDIDSYLDQKEKVFFIRNGMTLHSERASWLREYCGLTDLAPYMYIFVDISEISPALATMLHSGREEFRNTPTTRLTLERLKIFLEQFQDLDKEYGSMTVADTEIEDKDLKRQLAKEAAKDPELKKLFDLGDDFPTNKDTGITKIPYVGEYLPSKFDLIGPDVRYVEKKTYSKISFKTDATDDLFLRSEDKGEYDWDESDKFFISFNGIRRGVITFRIDTKAHIEVGASSEITFHLKVPSKNLGFSKNVKFKLIDTPEYVGEYFPSYFKLTKKVLKIPVGMERKLVLSTDVVDDYLKRGKDKGLIKLNGPAALEFTYSRLSDGMLIIGVNHLGNKIEKLEDIKIEISDAAGHNFTISSPVEIVPPDYDPNLKLPEPVTVNSDKWNDSVPAFTVEEIARIPSWSKFDKIMINTDSLAFEEMKQLSLMNRDRARDLMLKEIYIASIWEYLELKNLKNSNDDSYDVKFEAFNLAMRGIRKILLAIIKKSIR